MLSLLCVVVIFKTQTLRGIVQPCTNEGGDQFPERVVAGGASTRGSCSVVHIDIYNEILVPYEDSIKQVVCHIMDNKQLVPLQLDHDRELEVFYVDHKDIRNFIYGNECLDLGILHV